MVATYVVGLPAELGGVKSLPRAVAFGPFRGMYGAMRPRRTLKPSMAKPPGDQSGDPTTPNARDDLKRCSFAVKPPFSLRAADLLQPQPLAGQ